MAGNGKPEIPIVTKRWGTLPPNGLGIKSFTMRELTAADELLSAINADRFAPSGASGKVAPAMELALRERVRIALVEVNDQPVGGAGLPYMDLDRWPLKLYNAAKRAFIELNTMNDEEEAGFQAGGGSRPTPPPVEPVSTAKHSGS